MELDDERRQKGLEALAAISGSTGAAVVEGLKDIASDLADWIIAFSSLRPSTHSTWPARCSSSGVSRSRPEESRLT